MRCLPLLLCFATACVTVRVGELPPAPRVALGPALQLVDAVPGVACASRGDSALLEGEGVEALASSPVWPRDCLPAAKVQSDEALLKAAEVVLETPRAALRVAKATTRGVLANPRGWHRRGLRWALAITFEQAGLEGTVYVDGATGARLSGSDGRLGYGDRFFTVAEGRWGGTEAAVGYRPPNFTTVERTSLSTTLPDAEFVVYELSCSRTPEGCHLEHTQADDFCSTARVPACVEPLMRDFETRVKPLLARREPALAVLARKPGAVRWLTDSSEVFAFLGHKLLGIQEARLLLVAQGTLVPPPQFEGNYAGGYFRFEDPKVELTAGGCSGFYLESDGSRGPICLPRVPCHPPTADQRAALARSTVMPTQVCETGDGGFSFISSTSGCPCSSTWRKGVEVARNCAPCAHRAP